MSPGSLFVMGCGCRVTDEYEENMWEIGKQSSILPLVAFKRKNDHRDSGADTGFPEGWGANSWGGGAPTYKLARFSQKLHEIKKILVHGGGHVPGAPPCIRH